MHLDLHTKHKIYVTDSSISFQPNFVAEKNKQRKHTIIVMKIIDTDRKIGDIRNK